MKTITNLVFAVCAMMLLLSACAVEKQTYNHVNMDVVGGEETTSYECGSNADCTEHGFKYCYNGICISPMAEDEIPYPIADVVTAEDTAPDSGQDTVTEEVVQVQCDQHWQCDDDNYCTYDYCNNSVCGHAPRPEAVGKFCGRGICQTDGTCLPECLVDLEECGNEFCVCGGADWVECYTPTCWKGVCMNQYDLQLDCTHGCEDGACLEAECNYDSDCDDSNPCTDEVCSNGGCFYEQFDCGPEQVCIPQGDEYMACVVSCFMDQDCEEYDGGNVCTIGTCNADGYCEYVFDDGVICGDGGPCSEDNLCQYGVCQPAMEITGCMPCQYDEECDDGSGCTIDFCVGECEHIEIIGCFTCESPADCQMLSSKSCLDSDTELMVIGMCVGGVCQVIDNQYVCNLGCDESIGGCAPCVLNTDCNDNNPCTSDSCDAGKCFNMDDNCLYAGNYSKLLCSDNADCDGSEWGDYCVWSQGANSGLCQVCSNESSNPVPCYDGSSCHWGIVGGGGEWLSHYWCEENECQTAVDCDDGMVCTKDTCEAGVCVNAEQCTGYFDCAGECIHNALTVTCVADAECDLSPICDDRLGGVLEFTGTCLENGFCDMVRHDDDINWGGAEGCFPMQLCLSADECGFGSVCSKGYCFWNEGKPECIVHADCDDDNACTIDICGETGQCEPNWLNNGYCEVCESDADCLTFSTCTGEGDLAHVVSSDGTCQADKTCQRTIVECGYGCNQAGDYCLSPECTEDSDCGMWQFCQADYTCEYQPSFSNVECTFQCPAGGDQVSVWYGPHNEFINCNGEVWAFPEQYLCWWGEDHPTFSINLISEGNVWGNGDSVVLECNVPSEAILITPDPDYGDAGKMVVSITSLQCTY